MAVEFTWQGRGYLRGADVEAWARSRVRPDSNPGAETALIVDDERPVRRSLKRTLRQTAPSLTIFEAANGALALNKLAEIRIRYYHDPLFIILDLEMPVMSGWEVIEHLEREYKAKGETSGIPLLVFSSTSGHQKRFVNSRSVHGARARYVPLVTVAKEPSPASDPYDAAGEHGLQRWLHYFLDKCPPNRRRHAQSLAAKP